MSVPDCLPSEHKARDATSYDAIAIEFDRFSERFNEPLAARILQLAAPQSTDHIIDVGTGSGLVALRAAAIASKGLVIGVDHSAGMLEQAGAKAKQLDLSGIVDFQQMDAEQLDFPDYSFDIVLSLYALFHFPNPLRALKEMHRVLRPGGRIVIGVGQGPRLFSWGGAKQAPRVLWQFIARARGRLLIAPQFLRFLMRRHRLVPDDHRRLHARLPIRRLLRQAGFRHTHYAWYGLLEELSPEDFWSVQVTYSSEERMRLAEASVAEVTLLKQHFLEECQEVLSRNGKLVYPHSAMFYVSRRP